MEPGLLNIRNNIPQFARDETYALYVHQNKRSTSLSAVPVTFQSPPYTCSRMTSRQSNQNQVRCEDAATEAEPANVA